MSAEYSVELYQQDRRGQGMSETNSPLVRSNNQWRKFDVLSDALRRWFSKPLTLRHLTAQAQ